MSIDIEYKGSKLELSELVCDCGIEHTQPEMDIYLGSGIVDQSVKYIENGNISGRKVLIVTDNVVYDHAEKFRDILQEGGYKPEICLLDREEELVPDQTALGEILLALDKDIDFLAAVGSGTLNDLTRYTAYHTGRPFVSLGTAPSMDGYTSVIAPLIYNDLKVNKPALNPEVLILDLEVMQTAPYELILAGFGDVIGKYIALADWKLGQIINDEDYCPAVVEIIRQAVDRCMNNADAIAGQTKTGIKNLIEALILAGLTILIIDNTRPVSSIEHGMGHYLEMMKLLQKEKPARHGITVGVTTGYAVQMYEHFLKLDPDNINIEQIKNSRPAHKEWEQQVLDNYGDRLGSLILKKNAQGYPDWQEQKRRIEKVRKEWPEIKREMEFLPGWEELKGVYKKLGFPLRAQKIGVSETLIKKALLYGKDYRDRYTVFKTMSELGLLGEYTDKILENMKK